MDFKAAVEAIKEKVRIEDLLSCPHKSRAHNIGCVFPDHRDSSPSFQVRPETNSFRCFGCGRGGSVIDFVMERESLDFVEAVKFMASMANLELTPPTPEEQILLDREQKRMACAEYATSFYEAALHSEDGQEAYNYLRKRGFTDETIKALRLGYANRHLVQSVAKNKQLSDKGLSFQDFVDCGIIAQKDDGRYRDFFFNRITFPLLKGQKVVGMSARLIAGEGPKFLNLPAPSDEVPNGFPLALYNADALRRPVVYIGEGLPDTVSLIQWGVNATGAPGVGGVDRHAHRFKACKKVIFVWDNDTTGRTKRAEKAVKIQAEMEDGECYLVDLPPEVKDVNEWLQGGATAEDFAALSPVPLIFAMIEGIKPDAPAADKRTALQPIYKLIARLPALEQETYIKQIQQHLKVSQKVSKDCIKLYTPKVEAAKADEQKDDEIVFEREQKIVPAMDFDMETSSAMTAIHLLAKREIFNEATNKVETITALEPFLIRTYQEADGPRPTATPIRKLKLTQREGRRVPNETMSGRWRPEPEFPYSVANFLGGKIKQVDVAKLFDDIEAVFKRYIWLPVRRDYILLALKVMESYIYRMFDAIGYLHLYGTRESGKSQIMRLLEELCFNAKRSSSITESTLFRSVEANCGVFFVDEAEGLSNPQPGTAAQMISLLCNDSYKKGAAAQRNEQDAHSKKWVPTDYDVYCPKVFGSINEIGYVLSSRCIRIQCLRAMGDEAADLKDFAQNRHREQVVIEDIRDRLYCWAQLYWNEIMFHYTDSMLESPALKHLRGREREMWLPILAIANHIDMHRFKDKLSEAFTHTPEAVTVLEMLELQKMKQGNREAYEQEASMDLIILQALYEAIDGGELAIARASMDGGGHYYIFSDVAAHLSKKIESNGETSKERPCTPWKLNNVLIKSGVCSEDDKLRIRINGTQTRCICIRFTLVEQALKRLGGRVKAPIESTF